MTAIEDIFDEQVVPWFGTPLNFTDTVRMRMLRMRVGRQHAERVAAWYMRMRDLAKQGRVFGEFTTNVVVFAEALGAPIPEQDTPEFIEWFAERAELWSAFEAVGLVDLHGDPTQVDGTFRVVVLDFDETNWRRPASSAGQAGQRTRLTKEEKREKERERKRRQRAAKKGADAGMSADCPAVSHDVPLSRPIHTDGTYGTDSTDGPPRAHEAAATDTTQQRIAAKLAEVITDPDQATSIATEIVGMKSRASYPVHGSAERRRYDLDTWERATNVAVRRIAGGVDVRDVVGFIIGLLPSYTAPGSDEPVEIKPTVRSGGDPDLEQSDWAGYRGTVVDTESGSVVPS